MEVNATVSEVTQLCEESTDSEAKVITGAGSVVADETLTEKLEDVDTERPASEATDSLKTKQCEPDKSSETALSEPLSEKTAKETVTELGGIKSCSDHHPCLSESSPSNEILASTDEANSFPSGPAPVTVTRSTTDSAVGELKNDGLKLSTCTVEENRLSSTTDESHSAADAAVKDSSTLGGEQSNSVRKASDSQVTNLPEGLTTVSSTVTSQTGTPHEPQVTTDKEDESCHQIPREENNDDIMIITPDGKRNRQEEEEQKSEESSTLQLKAGKSEQTTALSDTIQISSSSNQGHSPTSKPVVFTRKPISSSPPLPYKVVAEHTHDKKDDQAVNTGKSSKPALSTKTVSTTKDTLPIGPFIISQSSISQAIPALVRVPNPHLGHFPPTTTTSKQNTQKVNVKPMISMKGSQPGITLLPKPTPTVVYTADHQSSAANKAPGKAVHKDSPLHQYLVKMKSNHEREAKSQITQAESTVSTTGVRAHSQQFVPSTSGSLTHARAINSLLAGSLGITKVTQSEILKKLQEKNDACGPENSTLVVTSEGILVAPAPTTPSRSSKLVKVFTRLSPKVQSTSSVILSVPTSSGIDKSNVDQRKNQKVIAKTETKLSEQTNAAKTFQVVKCGPSSAGEHFQHFQSSRLQPKEVNFGRSVNSKQQTKTIPICVKSLTSNPVAVPNFVSATDQGSMCPKTSKAFSENSTNMGSLIFTTSNTRPVTSLDLSALDRQTAKSSQSNHASKNPNVFILRGPETSTFNTQTLPASKPSAPLSSQTTNMSPNSLVTMMHPKTKETHSLIYPKAKRQQFCFSDLIAKLSKKTSQVPEKIPMQSATPAESLLSHEVVRTAQRNKNIPQHTASNRTDTATLKSPVYLTPMGTGQNAVPNSPWQSTSDETDQTALKNPVYSTTIRTGQGAVPVMVVNPNLDDDSSDSRSENDLTTTNSTLEGSKVIKGIQQVLPQYEESSNEETDSDIEIGNTEEQDMSVLTQLLMSSGNYVSGESIKAERPGLFPTSIGRDCGEGVVHQSVIPLSQRPDKSHTAATRKESQFQQQALSPGYSYKQVEPKVQDNQNEQHSFSSVSNSKTNSEIPISTTSKQASATVGLQAQEKLDLQNNDENVDEDDDCFGIKIESVYSLKDQAGLEEMARSEESFDAMQDTEAIQDVFNMRDSDDWKNAVQSCFVVLERLSKSDISVKDPLVSLSKCSKHCRKRTLDYLCNLQLLTCVNHPDVSLYLKPKKCKISKKVSEADRLKPKRETANTKCEVETCGASPLSDVSQTVNTAPVEASVTYSRASPSSTSSSMHSLAPQTQSMALSKHAKENETDYAESKISPKLNAESNMSPKFSAESNISPKFCAESNISPKSYVDSKISPKSYNAGSKISPKSYDDSKISPKSYNAGSKISPKLYVESKVPTQSCAGNNISPNLNSGKMSSESQNFQQLFTQLQAQVDKKREIMHNYKSERNVNNTGGQKSRLNIKQNSQNAKGFVAQSKNSGNSGGKLAVSLLRPKTCSRLPTPASKALQRSGGNHIKNKSPSISAIQPKSTTAQGQQLLSTQVTTSHGSRTVSKKSGTAALTSSSLLPTGSSTSQMSQLPSEKVISALKSLSSFLAATGRKVSENNAQYILLKIDQQHVLVKIPPNTNPQKLLDSAKSPEKQMHTVTTTVAKVIVPNPVKSVGQPTPSITHKADQGLQDPLMQPEFSSASTKSSGATTTKNARPVLVSLLKPAASQQQPQTAAVTSQTTSAHNSQATHTTTVQSLRNSTLDCPANKLKRGYNDSTSILSHLPTNSTMLPERRHTENVQTDEERQAKRRKLEARYPLPPGIIIKSEPEDPQYYEDSLHKCDSFQISHSTSISQVPLTQAHARESGQVAQKGHHGHTSQGEKGAAESNKPESHQSLLPENNCETSLCKNSETGLTEDSTFELENVLLSETLENVDDSMDVLDEPPPLIEETSMPMEESPCHPIDESTDSMEEMPPKLQPMFTSTCNTVVERDNDSGNPEISQNPPGDPSTTQNSNQIWSQQSNREVVVSDEVKRSVSTSSVHSLTSTDSGFSSKNPSSSSSASGMFPTGSPSTAANSSPFVNPKIQQLKELLKKKEMELENMRKRWSEQPVNDDIDDLI